MVSKGPNGWQSYPNLSALSEMSTATSLVSCLTLIYESYSMSLSIEQVTEAMYLASKPATCSLAWTDKAERVKTFDLISLNLKSTLQMLKCKVCLTIHLIIM